MASVSQEGGYELMYCIFRNGPRRLLLGKAVKPRAHQLHPRLANFTQVDEMLRAHTDLD